MRTVSLNPGARCLIQLNVAVLIWGGTAMFAKGIHLPVLDIICVRSLIAAAALLALLWATGRSARVRTRRHLAAMVLLGLLLCCHWLLYFQSLKVATAAVAILSLHTYPVFTAIVEPMLFREKIKRADLLLTAGVFAGVVVMTPDISLANSTTQGIVFGVVSGLFSMARNLMTRHFVQVYSSSLLMFWQTLVTGVLLLGPMTFLGQSQANDLRVWGLLILLGTVFTAIPQTLFAASLRHLSAKTVGILATLLPFYGALFGYLIHQEHVTSRTAGGGTIILACVVFETLRHARQPAPPRRDSVRPPGIERSVFRRG